MSLWWIWIPWFLYILARDLWLKYVRNKNVQKAEWILLEVIPPRDIQKTPKAMEQFFASLHGVHGLPNWWDNHIEGVTPELFSMETISQNGVIHFLIRTPSKYRDLIESNIYAQYPESEITQVDDYVDSFPLDIPNKEYDVFGTELMLMEDDAYPIRTYVEFEKDAAVDEQRIDPVASLLEVMSKLQQGEQVWIQILIRPVFDSWKKEVEELKNKLIGRIKERKKGLIEKEAVGWKDAGQDVFQSAITGKVSGIDTGEEGRKTDQPFLWTTTKSEQEAVYAIERNVSKVGYETIIRFIYIAKKDIFRSGYVKRAVYGAYKQLNTQGLNGFKRNGDVEPGIDYRIEFKELREQYRKKKVFANYRKRIFTQHSKANDYLKNLIYERLPVFRWFFAKSKPFIFNVEELATIYHFPTITVKSPLTPKVEARKGEPPADLPLK